MGRNTIAIKDKKTAIRSWVTNEVINLNGGENKCREMCESLLNNEASKKKQNKKQRA